MSHSRFNYLLILLSLAGCPVGTVAPSIDAGSEAGGPAADGGECRPLPFGTPAVLGGACCTAKASWIEDGGGALEALCLDGHWCARYRGDLFGSNPEECPIDDEPAIGSSCTRERLACVYTCPTLVDQTVVVCNAGRWCGAPKPPQKCVPHLGRDAGAGSPSDASDGDIPG